MIQHTKINLLIPTYVTILLTAVHSFCNAISTLNAIQDAVVSTVHIHTNNGIVMGGCTTLHEKGNPALIACDQQGILNTTFGDSGHLAFADLEGMIYAMQPDTQGDIIAVGNSLSENSLGLLIKADTTGSRVAQYGTNGVVRISLGTGATLNDMTLLKDGSVIAIGTAVINGTPRLFAVKVDPLGSIDYSWGDNGFVIPIMEKSWGKAIHLLSDGSLLLSGKAGSDKLCAVKLTPSGKIDISYGTQGFTLVTVIQGVKGGDSILDAQEQLCLVGGQGKQIYVAHLAKNGSVLTIFSPATTHHGISPGAIARVKDALYISGVDRKTAFLLKLDISSGTITHFLDLTSYLSDKTLLIFDGLNQPESLLLSAISVSAVNDTLYLSGTANGHAFVLKTDTDLNPDNTFGARGFIFFPDVTLLEFSDKGVYRPIPYLCWHASYQDPIPEVSESLQSSHTVEEVSNLATAVELSAGQMILDSFDPVQLKTIMISTQTLDLINALSKLQQIRPGDIIRITDVENTQAFIDCVVNQSITTSNTIILSVRTWAHAGTFSASSPLCLEQFGPTPLRIQYLFSCKTSKQIFATISAIPWTDIPFEFDHDICHGWTHTDQKAVFICPSDGVYHISYNARVAKADDTSSDNPTQGTPLVSFRTTANGVEIPGSRSALEVHDILVTKKASNRSITSEVINAHSHSNSFIAKLAEGDKIAFQIRKDAEPKNSGNPGIQLATIAGTSFNPIENLAPSMNITIVQIDQDL